MLQYRRPKVLKFRHLKKITVLKTCVQKTKGGPLESRFDQGSPLWFSKPPLVFWTVIFLGRLNRNIPNDHYGWKNFFLNYGWWQCSQSSGTELKELSSGTEFRNWVPMELLNFWNWNWNFWNFLSQFGIGTGTFGTFYFQPGTGTGTELFVKIKFQIGTLFRQNFLYFDKFLAKFSQNFKIFTIFWPDFSKN